MEQPSENSNSTENSTAPSVSNSNAGAGEDKSGKLLEMLKEFLAKIMPRK